MSLIYNTETEVWFYQKEKFMKDRKILRVLYNYFNPSIYCEFDKLYIPRLWNSDIVKEAMKYKDYYNYIIFDNNLFLHSNIQVETNRKYTKFPNGTTCRNALKQLKLQKNSSFLVVNDDGTRSTLPSMYYALKELSLLYLKKANSRLNFSTLYCKNYVSTTNTLGFSRAKYKLDYFNFYDTFDYIIIPAFEGIDTVKLEAESKKGYIIFGSLERLKDLPYNKMVIVNKACFIFKAKGVSTKSKCEVRSGKQSSKQLIDHLRKDFK